jgi:hypothetical protein
MKVVERESASKLEEKSTRLVRIEEQVATACRQAGQSAFGNI